MDKTAPITVPPDHYVLLGDNRDNAADSIFGTGMVAASEIIGRVVSIRP